MSGYIVAQLFADLADGIAGRENLLGIKRRAEGAPLGTPAMLHLELNLALWLAAFAGFLVAEAGLVVRRHWIRPLLVVSATALLAIGLILVRPPTWVDKLATFCVFMGLWWMYRGQAAGAVRRRGAPGTATFVR
jgi:hypothetical protein